MGPLLLLHFLGRTCESAQFIKMAGLVRNCGKLLSQSSSNVLAVRSMSGGHGDGGWKLWRNIFVAGAIPVIILGHVNAFGMGEEHERPEFIPYEHLRIRTKKFPWGDGNHSFIHNAHLNALPDGYEEH